MMQFNRHWSWLTSRSLIDTVEYDRQQGEPVTCVNRMDAVGQQMPPQEVELISRMYAVGDEFMTGTILIQSLILGDLVQT